MESNDKDIGPDPDKVLELSEKLPARTIEIFTIIINSFIFALLIIDSLVIKWSHFKKEVLVLFIFIFLFIFTILFFSIILRYWRAKSLIKTRKKKSGIIIALISIILSLFSVIFSNIESIVFEKNLNNLIIPCEPKPTINPYGYSYYTYLNNLYNSSIINKDKRRKLDYCPDGQNYIKNVRIIDELMMKLTTSLLEYFYSILFGLFIFLFNRIERGIDGPEKKNIFIVQNVETLQFSKNGDNSNIIVYNKRSNGDERNKIQNKNSLDTDNFEPINSQEKNLK